MCIYIYVCMYVCIRALGRGSKTRRMADRGHAVGQRLWAGPRTAWRRICWGFRCWNVACLTLVLLACPRVSPETQPHTSQYSHGVVVDAGSSGTRLRIYRWSKETDSGTLPKFTETYKRKKSPGISAFSVDISGLQEYIDDLVNYSKREVPTSQHGTTPFYVMATAGE